MKKFVIILLCVTGIITGMMLINSCSKNSEHRHEATVEHSQQKKLYHCPMHPTYTSDKPGECPICGMSLVPIEEEKPQVKKRIMYRSTMNPNEVSDKPGKDSMGMEMEAFEVEETPVVSTVEGRSIVKITPEKQQTIGVKTGIVELRKLEKTIRTVGKVDYVEPELAFINTKF